MTQKVTLFLAYVAMQGIDQQYNCYMQSVGLMFPPSVLILAMETQMAIAVGVTQVVPYIILMEDLPK